MKTTQPVVTDGGFSLSEADAMLFDQILGHDSAFNAKLTAICQEFLGESPLVEAPLAPAPVRLPLAVKPTIQLPHQRTVRPKAAPVSRRRLSWMWKRGIAAAVILAVIVGIVAMVIGSMATSSPVAAPLVPGIAAPAVVSPNVAPSPQIVRPITPVNAPSTVGTRVGQAVTAGSVAPHAQATSNPAPAGNGSPAPAGNGAPAPAGDAGTSPDPGPGTVNTVTPGPVDGAPVAPPVDQNVPPVTSGPVQHVNVNPVSPVPPVVHTDPKPVQAQPDQSSAGTNQAKVMSDQDHNDAKGVNTPEVDGPGTNTDFTPGTND